MFGVQLGNVYYKFKFCKFVNTTMCHIWCLTTKNRRKISVGVAIKHPVDRDDKLVGKKIALTRAISQANANCLVFNKEQRKEIWAAFWNWVSCWNSKLAYTNCPVCKAKITRKERWNNKKQNDGLKVGKKALDLSGLSVNN